MEKKSTLCGAHNLIAPFAGCDTNYRRPMAKLKLTANQCEKLQANGFVDIVLKGKNLRVSLNR